MNTINCIAPGWFNVKHIYSPNYGLRPANDISLVVIHNISLPPEHFENEKFGYITDLFTNKLNPNIHEYFKNIYDKPVSSHFLIQRNGLIIQYVSTFLRAWHAGKSIFLGQENCNDYSIGIELEGSDRCSFEICQYQGLIRLLDGLKTYHKSLKYITGHSYIAPNRKTDPGEFFDWNYIIKYAKGWNKENIIF